LERYELKRCTAELVKLFETTAGTSAVDQLFAGPPPA
jgi:hypothetical protein